MIGVAISVTLLAAVGVASLAERKIRRRELQKQIAENAYWKSGAWIKTNDEEAESPSDIEDTLEDELDFQMQKSMARSFGGGDNMGAETCLFAPAIVEEKDSGIVEEKDSCIGASKPSICSRMASSLTFVGALVGFVCLHVGDLTCRALSKNPTTGRVDYFIPTVLLVSNVISIFIGHFVTYHNEGLSGVKQIWDYRLMLKLAVASVCFNFESMGRFVAIDLGMQPDMVMVINRLSVVLLAIFMTMVLKRKQNMVQWMLLLSLIAGVCLFLRLKSSLITVSEEEAEAKAGGSMFLGLLTAVGAMVIGVVGESSQTIVLMNNDRPTYIMKTVQDVPGMLVFACLCIGNSSLWTNGFFHGWNRWCFVIAGLFLGKIWCSFMIIKLLGPVVKQVASVGAVVLQYLVGMLLFSDKAENKFDVSVFLSVVLLSCGVMCYTVETRARQKRKQKKDLALVT